MDKPFLEMLLENFVDKLKDISSVKKQQMRLFLGKVISMFPHPVKAGEIKEIPQDIYNLSVREGLAEKINNDYIPSKVIRAALSYYPRCSDGGGYRQ